MIVPPATLGMLGGGQLGRYALISARLAGYRTIVLDPDPAAPAGAVADEHLVAPFDDPAAVATMAARCALVTTEFENPPASTLDRLAAAGVVVAPSPAAVAVCQDRIAEKAFLTSLGVLVASYAVVVAEPADDAPLPVASPAILKTARCGYDGKGQRAVERAADVAAAWRDLGSVPCVLEQRVALDVEVSVVVARSADGRAASFAVAENHHVDGILDLTVVPARVVPALADQAVELATRVVEALEYVGVLAVEMFVSDGELLVNELAPRPHNSGHWTLDAATTSQFDQQVRAVCGLALGPTAMTAPAAAMVNLLGDRWRSGEPDWTVPLADPHARLHLYGKAEARPGRKMGHLTVLADDPDDAARRALELRDALVAGTG